MTDREDFERLVLPLMRWLRATRNPHTSVIVTSACAEMVSGEMSVVESDERIIECVCAEIDTSDRPCLVCECSAPAQDAPIDRHPEGFCACGRRTSECDRSRKACASSEAL